MKLKILHKIVVTDHLTDERWVYITTGTPQCAVQEIMTYPELTDVHGHDHAVRIYPLTMVDGIIIVSSPSQDKCYKDDDLG
jgi:hypothetical protein